MQTSEFTSRIGALILIIMNMSLLNPSERTPSVNRSSEEVESNSKDVNVTDWTRHLPVEFFYAKKIITSPQYLKVVKYLYIVTTITLMAFYLFIIAKDLSHGLPNAQIIHYILQRLQDVAYAMVPLLTYYYLEDFFNSVDSPVLISGAVSIERNLSKMFNFISHANLLLLTFALITYEAFSSRPVSYKIISSFYSVLYLFPFCLSYSLSVCIMVAHRVHATDLNAHIMRSRQDLDTLILHATALPPHTISTSLVSGNAYQSDAPDCNDIMYIYRRYRTLHAHCLKTSLRRGWFMLLIGFLAVMFAVTTVWDIYLDRQLLASSLAFFGITVFILLQLGWSVAACNEMGHLACRELCTYVMCREELFRGDGGGAVDCSAATLLLGCVSYAKLEVVFFSNFALRSRHLAALISALVGSVVPAIVLGKY